MGSHFVSSLLGLLPLHSFGRGCNVIGFLGLQEHSLAIVNLLLLFHINRELLLVGGLLRLDLVLILVYEELFVLLVVLVLLIRDHPQQGLLVYLLLSFFGHDLRKHKLAVVFSTDVLVVFSTGGLARVQIDHILLLEFQQEPLVLVEHQISQKVYIS